MLLFTGVQREFNFTSPPNVLKEDTSPYLSDGEGWEIPAPLNLPQMSSVEEDKSFETVKKTDSDNTQSKPANEFFVDETWGLSVSHEEEIVSSHNQEGLNLEGFVVNKESDNMRTSVNTYELGVKCMDFDNSESTSKASLMAIKAVTVENTEVQIGSLESLLGPSFDVRTVDNGIFSPHTNRQQAESNLSLKNLLSGSIYHSNTNVGYEVRSADEIGRVGRVKYDVMNSIIPTKTTHLMSLGEETFSENGENVTTSMLRTDVSVEMGEQPKPGKCRQTEIAVPAEILTNDLPSMSSEPSILTNVDDEMTGGNAQELKPQSAVMEEVVTKRNLKLNLATLLGTDEIISTPVVLESLFKRDEPFDLLSYVFDEVSPVTNVLSI
jgi:hypothetical protein